MPVCQVIFFCFCRINFETFEVLLVYIGSSKFSKLRHCERNYDRFNKKGRTNPSGNIPDRE